MHIILTNNYNHVYLILFPDILKISFSQLLQGPYIKVIFKKIYFYFMFMSILPARMYVRHIHAWYPQEPWQ